MQTCYAEFQSDRNRSNQIIFWLFGWSEWFWWLRIWILSTKMEFPHYQNLLPENKPHGGPLCQIWAHITWRRYFQLQSWCWVSQIWWLPALTVAGPRRLPVSTCILHSSKKTSKSAWKVPRCFLQKSPNNGGFNFLLGHPAPQSSIRTIAAIMINFS